MDFILDITVSKNEVVYIRFIHGRVYYLLFSLKKGEDASKTDRLSKTNLTENSLVFLSMMAPTVTFITTALYVGMGRKLRKALRPRILALESPVAKMIYDMSGIFLTTVGINYAAVPFMLLGLSDTLAAWKAVGFYGSIGLPVFHFILLPLLQVLFGAPPKDASKEGSYDKKRMTSAQNPKLAASGRLHYLALLPSFP